MAVVWVSARGDNSSADSAPAQIVQQEGESYTSICVSLYMVYQYLI